METSKRKGRRWGALLLCPQLTSVQPESCRLEGCRGRRGLQRPLGRGNRGRGRQVNCEFCLPLHLFFGQLAQGFPALMMSLCILFSARCFCSLWPEVTNTLYSPILEGKTAHPTICHRAGASRTELSLSCMERRAVAGWVGGLEMRGDGQRPGGEGSE